MPEAGYCECGCGQRAPIAKRTRRDKGHVAGQPVRFIHGHNGGRVLTLESYRVEDRGHETPCWIWHGHPAANGYGYFTVRGRKRLAHRATYEHLRSSIPAGLQLDHLCRVPLCVNPDHLEPVTNAENTRRGARAVLTADQVEDIRRSSETTAEISRRLGVPNQTVDAARSGRTVEGA